MTHSEVAANVLFSRDRAVNRIGEALAVCETHVDVGAAGPLRDALTDLKGAEWDELAESVPDPDATPLEPGRLNADQLATLAVAVESLAYLSGRADCLAQATLSRRMGDVRQLLVEAIPADQRPEFDAMQASARKTLTD